MEWVRIFKLFNLHKMKSNWKIYVFIAISIVIVVSISLSIPQITAENEKYFSENAYNLNGGSLKVESPYPSNSFDKSISSLKNEGVNIFESMVITTNLVNGSNRLVGSLLIGDYSLADDEIIIYKSLAEKLDVKVDDLVSIADRTYTVVDIEKTAKGVDSQSEIIGYGKVSSYNEINRYPTNILYFIDYDDPEELKEKLNEIEPGYKYTTTNDKIDSMKSEWNINLVMLNILITMSTIMTILSVISSVFVIVVQRQKDIAIMRMISIKINSIKKAMRMELYSIVFIPVFIGSILSNLLARVLLKTNGISYQGSMSDIIKIVVPGFLLYLFVFFIFIKIATVAIEAISPLFIMRDDLLSWKSSKRKITWLSIFFINITLILYAIYIGQGSVLISSIAIVFFIIMFFIISIIVINLFAHFPSKMKLFMYSKNNLKKNKYSFIIIILSITFTIWFLLIGFTLENTVRDSYSLGVEQKLSYNYMVFSEYPESFEDHLKGNNEIEGYTKMLSNIGILMDNNGINIPIQLSEVSESSYGLKFNILEGKNLFDGSYNEVIISSDFSQQNELTIGDALNIWINEQVVIYQVKGIYDAGGINQTTIIKPVEDKPVGNAMFLLKTDSKDFLQRIDNASVMHISVMGNALMDYVSGFLTVFKWLSLICIFSSVFFNFNIVYMSFINEYKETVIIRALGIEKGFLYKHLAFKFITVLISSTILSLGLYTLIVRLALNVMFEVNLRLSIGTIILPISCGVILISILFLIPFYIIKNAHGFEELREQV